MLDASDPAGRARTGEINNMKHGWKQWGWFWFRSGSVPWIDCTQTRGW